MQLLGLGLIPFFISCIFQYLYAALDAQKKFFWSTLVGSVLRVILLVALIPRYNFVGPAVAFCIAEILTVGLWIYELQKLGYPAQLPTMLWRPVMAGAVMAAILYALLDASRVWQIVGAGGSLLAYVLVLLVLRTFSSEEIDQAREGMAFVSPFVASWTKKLRRNP
jgi:O-antigen/teichoic acid export membrane protein